MEVKDRCYESSKTSLKFKETKQSEIKQCIMIVIWFSVKKQYIMIVI